MKNMQKYIFQEFYKNMEIEKHILKKNPMWVAHSLTSVLAKLDKTKNLVFKKLTTITN
jgi:hypothetical protein